MPESVGSNLRYNFDDGKKLCKLHLIKANGTQWNVTLGRGENIMQFILHLQLIGFSKIKLQIPNVLLEYIDEYCGNKKYV